MNLRTLFVKALFAGLLTLVFTFLYSLAQYNYQVLQQEFYIKIGFPYQFYFFTLDLELHGGHPLHLIYDSFLLFVFSFLIVHIAMKLRKRRKVKTGSDFVDEEVG